MKSCVFCVMYFVINYKVQSNERVILKLNYKLITNFPCVYEMKLWKYNTV